ncbi:MAG: dihydroorotase [Phycisphaera sp.]|nr:MAG: dihydroorotase [Phycisphaera sp.]
MHHPRAGLWGPGPDLGLAMASILIRGGRVIDPASGTDDTLDVLIEGDRITRIAKGIESLDGQVIDASGLIVSPGLIDPHVHLREPGQEHKETIQTGSQAAVAGGFTTVCCMPNTAPTLDSPEIVRFVYDRARDAACRVYPVAAGTVGRQGEQMTEIQLLAQAGAIGISDDGDVIVSAGMMKSVLTATASAGLCFMQHCQEPTLTRNASMHAGGVSTRLGLGGWPRVAEELIIERDVRLVGETGCRYHVQHLSCAGSVDLIRAARGRGLPVTAEASPHHLLLTEEACLGYDTNTKMNPPLREHSDIEAIKQGVADGTITILATDHAPHAPDEKALPFNEAPFGIIGLETALAGYAQALVEPGNIDWPKLIELITVNPAKLCNLDRDHLGEEGLGELREGGLADVTLIDPNLEWTVTKADLEGLSCNTPFLGRSFSARPVMTVVGGQIRHSRLESHAAVYTH